MFGPCIRNCVHLKGAVLGLHHPENVNKNKKPGVARNEKELG